MEISYVNQKEFTFASLEVSHLEIKNAEDAIDIDHTNTRGRAIEVDPKGLTVHSVAVLWCHMG
jgi:hypothetical protein